MDHDLRPGLYEHIVTETLERALADVKGAELRTLDPSDAHVVFSQFLAEPLRVAFARVAEGAGDDEERLARQVELVNAIVALLDERAVGVDAAVASPARELMAVVDPEAVIAAAPPRRPHTPLRSGALLVNNRHEPSIGQEIPLEIESADEISLLCAFVRWSGLRLLIEGLRQHTHQGKRLRVITTTYCAATEPRALDALREIGAEVRVSYETQATRLHAKAWLFERAGGLSTAYVGSSNMSRSALLDGLEWNVRLAEAETPFMVERFRKAFDTLWADEHIEDYDPQKFRRAIDAERRGDVDEHGLPLMIDLVPRPFQQEILDRLDAERHRHGRWRNLVVAATGTGKTILAALDYQRLRTQVGQDQKLLFVAHRDRILRQSRAAFQLATRESAFGEIYAGGDRPKAWRHVFANVQSLASVDLTDLASDHFDVIVIDEFHHAAAPTYERLLEHFTPRVLLGLTATPERSDGKDIRRWFDYRFAAEVRLWDAIESQLLVPFHYFGIHDDVDLTAVAWQQSGYDKSQLDGLYTGNDARVLRILQQIDRIVADPRQMRALGFCVSVDHAHFMSAAFTQRGIPSASVDGATPSDERDRVIQRLVRSEINCVFSVDVFNEGVDIPAVDTILMLRPTESATVFLQQLGRGLRRTEDKAVCTVLDFIGNQRKEFRFAPRYTSMLGVSRQTLVNGIVDGFPTLPAGVHFELDCVAREYVLGNLKATVGGRTADLVADLRSIGPEVALGGFLDETGRELRDVFRSPTGKPGWSRLRRFAGFEEGEMSAADERVIRAMPRLLHIDDEERLGLYRDVLAAGHALRFEELGERETRMLSMLHMVIWGDYRKTARPLSDGLRDLLAAEAGRRDLAAVVDYLIERSPRITLSDNGLPPEVPLRVHASYSSAEILAALGASTPLQPRRLREGVLFRPDLAADFFFVTALSSEGRYRPSVLYRNHPVSRQVFHLETQSRESPSTTAGRRYLNHRDVGTGVHLFYRANMSSATVKAMPYVYLGPMDYLSHSGERPIGIEWRLRIPMPEEIYSEAVDAAVG